MSTLDKQKRLINHLVKQTNTGQLAWQEGVVHDSYQVILPTSAVRIREEEGDRGIDIVIELMNNQGVVVDEVRDVTLDNDEGNVSELVWFKKMRDLYALSRRSALGSDKVLRDILGFFGDDED